MPPIPPSSGNPHDRTGRLIVVRALFRNVRVTCAVAVVLVVAVAAYFSEDWARWVDRSVFDKLAIDRAENGIDTDIVWVQLDASIIQPGGGRPRDRALLASGIDKIRIGNPRVIGIDLMWSDRLDPEAVTDLERLATLFRETLLERSGETGAFFDRELTRLIQKRHPDRLLVNAVRHAGNVVWPIGIDRCAVDGGNGPGLSDGIPRSRILKSTGFEGSGIIPPSVSCVRIPFAELVDAAAALGHGYIPVDSDGGIRRLPLFLSIQDGWVPAFPLVMVAVYGGMPLQEVRVDTAYELMLGERPLPVSTDGTVFVRFRPAADAFPIVSFDDVIADRVSAGLFENRMVWMGFSPGTVAPGSPPVMREPSDRAVFMVQAASALLKGHTYRTPRWARCLEVAMVLVVLGMGIGLRRFPTWFLCTVFFLVAVGLVLVSMGMLHGRKEWITVGLPVTQALLYGVVVAMIHPFQVRSMRAAPVGNRSWENLRMLGVVYQNKGQLDKAFDTFRRIPTDDHLKELLYNLALDYERRHQPHKAASVFEYIAEYDPQFRDIADRRKHLLHIGETVVIDRNLNVVQPPNHPSLSMKRSHPSSIGRYEIVREIGKGAMGVVYLGMDPRIRRLTSIKTFRFPEDADPKMIEQHKTLFFQEAASAGALSHPHIVTIYDAGEERNLAYIAMEYLDGTSLNAFTRTENLLPMPTVVSYAADVADALAYAHQKRVIHQDIKPANIMLLKTGEIKVTDFGIAQMMAASQHPSKMIMGTPSYMSPEQFSGQPVDGRSDIFSLGVTLYQLLTGRLPFTGNTLQELMRCIVQQPHPDPKQVRSDIPNPLVQILHKALEKDASRRYADAAQMAEHLRRLSNLMKGVSRFQR